MPDALKHHLPAHNELDGTFQIPCTCCGQSALRPWPQFASKSGTKEPRDDLYLLWRNSQHLRKNIAMINDRLRCLIESELLTVVDCNRRMKLNRIMCFGRDRIDLIDLHLRTLQRRRRVAALALLIGLFCRER